MVRVEPLGIKELIPAIIATAVVIECVKGLKNGRMRWDVEWAYTTKIQLQRLVKE